MDLPCELVYKLCEFLSIESCFNLMQTCHRIYKQIISFTDVFQARVIKNLLTNKKASVLEVSDDQRIDDMMHILPLGRDYIAVNDPMWNDSFCLRWYAKYGYVDWVKRLLDDDRVDLSTYGSKVAITLAIKGNHANVLILFIKDKRIDFRTETVYEDTSYTLMEHFLICLSRGWSRELITALVEKGYLGPQELDPCMIKDIISEDNIELVKICLNYPNIQLDKKIVLECLVDNDKKLDGLLDILPDDDAYTTERKLGSKRGKVVGMIIKKWNETRDIVYLKILYKMIEQRFILSWDFMVEFTQLLWN